MLVNLPNDGAGRYLQLEIRLQRLLIGGGPALGKWVGEDLICAHCRLISLLLNFPLLQRNFWVLHTLKLKS